MSIIDNLLVLLDDGSPRTLDEINHCFPHYSKQIVSASLGRIVSKNYLRKVNDKYSVSTNGQNIITQNLDNLDRFDKREDISKISFILFDIPEKQRINRDIMRNFLTSNGYGRLHKTMWISLNKDHNRMVKLVNDLKIDDRTLIFNAKIDFDEFININQFVDWNFEKINSKYKDFITESTLFIKSKNKNNTHARCLVYNFAKAIAQDPLLPKEFLDKQYLGDKAFDIYNKIRKFCY